jgi:hypothetical protein
MISINIAGPDIDSEIKRLIALDKSVEPRRILKAAGKQLQDDLQDHFSSRNSEPNKQGWPKKNFWAGIANATKFDSSSVSDSEAIVVINDPAINQKVYGGTIRPTHGRALAIPMNADAYKAGSPRKLQTNFLRLLVTRSGAYLVEREATKIGLSRRKKGGYRPTGQIGEKFWYHLVPSVTQAKDERALPESSFLEGSVMSAIRGVFEAELQKSEVRSQ